MFSQQQTPFDERLTFTANNSEMFRFVKSEAQPFTDTVGDTARWVLDTGMVGGGLILGAYRWWWNLDAGNTYRADGNRSLNSTNAEARVVFRLYNNPDYAGDLIPCWPAYWMDVDAKIAELYLLRFNVNLSAIANPPYPRHDMESSLMFETSSTVLKPSWRQAQPFVPWVSRDGSGRVWVEIERIREGQWTDNTYEFDCYVGLSVGGYGPFNNVDMPARL